MHCTCVRERKKRQEHFRSAQKRSPRRGPRSPGRMILRKSQKRECFLDKALAGKRLRTASKKIISSSLPPPVLRNKALRACFVNEQDCVIHLTPAPPSPPDTSVSLGSQRGTRGWFCLHGLSPALSSCCSPTFGLWRGRPAALSLTLKPGSYFFQQTDVLDLAIRKLVPKTDITINLRAAEPDEKSWKVNEHRELHTSFQL